MDDRARMQRLIESGDINWRYFKKLARRLPGGDVVELREAVRESKTRVPAGAVNLFRMGQILDAEIEKRGL